ncbi:MAG TPA: TorF family putative porin [Sphingomonadaceae bacterium]
MLTSVRSLLAATILAGCAFAATPALADDAAPADPTPEFTVTGNVALVTDYRFRGVSQSAGDPAIQGGLTLNHKSGLYVGAWSSSINFANVGADATFGNQELDLFGGWTGSLTNNLTLDAGLLYYAYPGGHVGKAEFFEPYASLSTTVGPAKLKVGANYAWSQDAIYNDDNLYLYTNVDIGIPNTPVTVSGHLGYQDGPLAADFWSSPDETTWDWSIGASATVLGHLSLGVAYVGNGSPAIDGLTDDAVVGTLSASF